jgi:hypothetical protein
VFLLISVSVLRLIDTQQQPPAASTEAASSVISSSQSHKQPTNNPILLQPVFYIQYKQGGVATVLGKGCDTVTRETCDHYSLNINI